MRRLCALTCAGLLAAGCAGREPVPVSAYMPNDAGMTCDIIGTEIQGNNDAIRNRVAEAAEVQDKNIVLGASAALLFLPMAFAMDLKGAAGTEANSFEQRNRTLTGLASDKGCAAPAAITVTQATEEHAAQIAASKAARPVDVPGVKNPSDQRLQQLRTAPPLPELQPAPAAGQAPGPVSVQASATPTDPGQRQDLMDRFLRGEISKEEYERLRGN